MTLLAVYFIFILDHRNDVRQKVNSSNFFFKFKIGLKTEETACNINSKLTQELLMNVQGSGDSRTRGLPLEIDNDQLRDFIKVDAQNYMKSCQRSQHQPFYSHLAFEANWKGEKAQ